MVRKKTNKKEIVKKTTPKKQETTTTLSDIIRDADEAIVITSIKGNIEVTGIKNINYAYEAKGLLIGAIDTYNSRPIINGLNNNTRAIISHLININTKVTELSNSDKKE